MSDRAPHRLLPHPRLSLVLFVVWILVANDFGVGTVLMALVLGVAIPALTRNFWPEAPTPRHPWLAFTLLAKFLFDIVVANFTVAKQVVMPNARLRPTFVEIPLALTDDFAIALLASMITLTPGTVSADLTPDRSRLLVHVLHTDDAQDVVDTIKRRYEAPLARILQC